MPDAISNLVKLVVLKLHMNNLSGTIPSTFSNLANLSALNLSQNSFMIGTIPAMPTSLSTILNLSHNHLSGYIPSNIGYLTEIEILNLSCSLDITANPGLTNGKGNNNGTPTNGKRRPHNVVIIIFAIVGALVGLCSLAANVMVSYSREFIVVTTKDHQLRWVLLKSSMATS